MGIRSLELIVSPVTHKILYFSLIFDDGYNKKPHYFFKSARFKVSMKEYVLTNPSTERFFQKATSIKVALSLNVFHPGVFEKSKILTQRKNFLGLKHLQLINTSYLTDSYISFTLKLESGQNFCYNRSIRSSTYGKKNIFEIPPCGSHFLLIHFTY